MKFRSIVLTAIVGLLLSAAVGCSFKHAKVPEADIPFARADYSLGDKVSQESCNTYIFGIDFSALFGSDTAAVPTGAASALPIPIPGTGFAPEVNEAMYNAVQKMPDATHVVQPRIHTTTKGLVTFGTPIFGKRCGQVDAVSATIKGPYKYAE